MSHMCDIKAYICHMNETKSKILHAAIALLAKDANVTLDEIAKHIGVTRRTLHRHYDGRKDLIDSVLRGLLEEYMGSVKEQLSQDISDLDKLKSLLCNDIESVEKYLVFTNIQRTEKTNFYENNTEVKELHLLYRHFFERLIAQGLIVDTFNIEWVEAYYTSVVEASIKAIQNGLSVEECIKMAWKSFQNGIIKQ